MANGWRFPMRCAVGICLAAWLTLTLNAEELMFVVLEAPGEVRLNQPIAYTIAVHSYSRAVKDVRVKAVLPAGVKYRERTEGLTLRWNLGELAPRQDIRLTCSVEAIRTGTFTTEAEVYSGEHLVHRCQATTKVVAPRLCITLDGPRLTTLRRLIPMQITITNKGDGTARDLEVAYTLPRQCCYIGSDPPGIYRTAQHNKPATVTWHIAQIPPQSKAEIVVQIRGVKGGRCINLAKVACQDPDPPLVHTMEASLEIEIMICTPAVHISTYDTEDPVAVGKNTVYVLEIRNEGTSKDTGMVMKSIIPPEMKFIKAEGPNGAGYRFDKPEQTVIFDAVPVLPPMGKLTYKVLCQAIRTGTAKHYAALKYNELPQEITDEEVTTVNEQEASEQK